MNSLLLDTGIKNPFFGVPPGQVMHTELIPGTGIENPLFGIPPGHWDISQLIQAIGMNNGAAAAFHQPFMQPLNAIAGAMGDVESRFDALLNAMEHTPPGQFMHTLLLDTGIENPFFGVPPGHVMHTEFIPGTGIENPLFGVPPGHWDISQLIQAISMMMPIVPTG